MICNRCYSTLLGGAKSVSLVVLDINGISFAIQLILILLIEAYADCELTRRGLLSRDETQCSTNLPSVLPT